ncbi:hypothetical protein Tco_0960180 [Tanacetum coccineum]
MDLWKSQREDHTSDWLRAIPISGLFKGNAGDVYRVDICFRSGISAGKEVDIGLDGGSDKPLRQHICYFTRGMEDLMCVWI